MTTPDLPVTIHPSSRHSRPRALPRQAPPLDAARWAYCRSQPMASGCSASAAVTVSHTHPPRSVPSWRLRVIAGFCLQSTYRPPDRPCRELPPLCPASHPSPARLTDSGLTSSACSTLAFSGASRHRRNWLESSGLGVPATGGAASDVSGESQSAAITWQGRTKPNARRYATADVAN